MRKALGAVRFIMFLLVVGNWDKASAVAADMFEHATGQAPPEERPPEVQRPAQPTNGVCDLQAGTCQSPPEPKPPAKQSTTPAQER
jgi:hypothetical protein